MAALLLPVALLLASPRAASALRAEREEDPPAQVAPPAESSSPVHKNASGSGRKVTKWPEYLKGHNIIFAGDSNDRKLVSLVCGWYKADLKQLLTSDVGKNPWDTNTLIWPTPSQSTYCHIKSNDMFVINLQHFGVMFGEPWFQQFLQREEELRLPEVPWKGTGFRRRVWASPRQYPEIIWPQMIRKITKTEKPRPTVFVLQSSLWDAVPLADMARAACEDGGGVCMPELQRQYFNVSWARRASFLVDAVRHSIPGLRHLVWRTTPGCPADNTAVSRLLEFQAQDAARAIDEARGNISRFEGNQLAEAKRWHDVELLDWAAAYNVTTKEQCEGSHYPSIGYRALLQGLFNLSQKLHEQRQL